MATAPGIGESADTPRGPAVESGEQLQALVRTTVADATEAAVAETMRMIRQLERRIEELERRPAASPTTGAVAAPSAPSPPWAQAPVPASAPQGHVAARPAPVIDLATIERSVHVQLDPALDGGRRRKRLRVGVVLFFVIVFGGLFALLAQSYTPQP